MTDTYALFDFAGTLADLVPSTESIYGALIFHETGIKVEDGLLLSRIDSLVSTLPAYSSVLIRSKSQKYQYYNIYNQHILQGLGLIHKISPEAVYAQFSRTKRHWQLKKGVLDIFYELSGLQIKIGILSNFDSHLVSIVADLLGPNHLPDYLHISQSEGHEKPSPEFYRTFFEKYNIDPLKCTYFGDSYLLDFLPATKLGMQAYLLDESNRFPWLSPTIPKITSSLNILKNKINQL
ncbi:HAD family hydrolase [Synechococcus sp. AH-224-G16]|nr:HAD family hydrolase [Synechococcus sp. AH-224-G16]